MQVMSSIVEEALNSLRLALQLKNLNVRFYDNKDWVEIRMKSLSYKDVESKTDLLHKRIEFDSVSKSHMNLRAVQLPSDKKSMQHDIEMLMNFKTDIFSAMSYHTNSK